MEPIKSIQGMRDLLPDQTRWWQRMERQLAEVLDRSGYEEIRTPLLEQTELFARSIGLETDIVSKEMYTFRDRDQASLTLRPEGTASAARAYLQHDFQRHQPLCRLYYQGPMFRHERTQKGRYRQFHQLGAELIGAADPAADIELIELMVDCVRAVGLERTSLELNSLGCPGCRPAYRERLLEFLTGHRAALCEDCGRRLVTNPLRVLDCKEAACAAVANGAPHMLDHLCDACRTHFGTVQAGLEALEIPHHLNHRMVRGLDYYTRTTFELVAEGLGAQNTVAAGGRYDGLFQQLGGVDVPAVGFAAGLDRLQLLVAESAEAPSVAPVVFVVPLGEAAGLEALRLMQRLRRAGLRVLSDVRRGSFKAQLKRADRDGARLVLLLGDDELKAGEVTIRDMLAADDSAKQQRVPLRDIVDLVRMRLRG